LSGLAKLRNSILGAALFIAALSVLQLYSSDLELNRELVLSGQLWRVWTGHLVHTNLPHFLLNLSVALIIYFTFFSSLKPARVLASALVLAPLISATLLWFYPQVAWYNGLSGLLHALLAFFSLRLVLEGDRVFWVGLCLVWLKVLAEAAGMYPAPGIQHGVMRVLTEAHLAGALVGTIFALLVGALRRYGSGIRLFLKGHHNAKSGIDTLTS
jgi:rhomboid family GlyGly-CTERM serine protease